MLLFTNVWNAEFWADYGSLGIMMLVLIISISLVARWAGRLIEKALNAFVEYLKEATKMLAEMRDTQNQVLNRLGSIEDRITDLEIMKEEIISSNESMISKVSELLNDGKSQLDIFITTIKDFKK